MKQPIILDISSSDDEVGYDDSSTADNFDWISKLLDDSLQDNVVDYTTNNGGGDDDGDDVVVVGEVFATTKRGKGSGNNYRNLGFDNDDDDDDDCVVLNCDPEKPPTIETVGEGERKGSDEDSEDVLIIGEKGQVACRDYPHSRHLCAKFPFGSTPHESHCDLCHCYVCDTLAPCGFWGSGVSDLDHCCATDKSKYWRTGRKQIRQSKNPSAPVAKLKMPSRSTLVKNPASTYGVPSSFGLPNIISQGRNQRLNLSLQRKRFRSHEVAGQLLRSCNTTSQSLRTSSLASSRALFKRPGRMNQSVYVPPNNASRMSYWQQLLTESSSPQLDRPLASSISSGTLPSPIQGYNSPLSPTPTSHFQKYCQSNVVRNDFSSVFHSTTSSALHSVSQIGSGPISPPCNTSYVPSSITPGIPQPSKATHNISSSDFPYNTPNSMIGIAHNPQVEGAFPGDEFLSSIEHYDKEIFGSSNFDLDGWLPGNDPILDAQDELDLYHLDNQPSAVDAGMLYFDFDTSWRGLAHQ